MTQFEYDAVMKRYNVKVPYTLAGESSRITVAAISEDKDPKITMHRELSVTLLRNILLAWEEFNFQEERRIEREDEGSNKLLTNNKKKGDK
mgnify:CR=1 FL=1